MRRVPTIAIARGGVVLGRAGPAERKDHGALHPRKNVMVGTMLPAAADIGGADR